MRSPSAADLARVVATQAACELTYAEHGATGGSLPAGYRHDQWEADLGSFDEATFDRLGAAICQWQVQHGAGLTIYPADPVRPDLTVALCIRLQGEEAFHVVRHASRILFRVTAFSRPRHPLARIGAPVSRLIQQHTSQAYLRAMREVAA